jgi:hypothetical protein
LQAWPGREYYGGPTRYRPVKGPPDINQRASLVFFAPQGFRTLWFSSRIVTAESSSARFVKAYRQHPSDLQTPIYPSDDRRRGYRQTAGLFARACHSRSRLLCRISGAERPPAGVQALHWSARSGKWHTIQIIAEQSSHDCMLVMPEFFLPDKKSVLAAAGCRS